MVDSYFEAVDMIAQEPKKSFEIMGAVVKQTGEQFEKSQSYLRWQDREANKQVLRGRHAGLQPGGGRASCSSSASSRTCPTSPRSSTRASSSEAGVRGGRARALTPLVPVSRPVTALALGVAFFVVFVARLGRRPRSGGFVNRTFLADPRHDARRRAGSLLVVHGFYADIGVTIWRVFGGFALAAAIGVPLGHRSWAPTSRSRRSSSRSSPSRATCPPRRSSRS